MLVNTAGQVEAQKPHFPTAKEINCRSYTYSEKEPRLKCREKRREWMAVVEGATPWMTRGSCKAEKLNVFWLSAFWSCKLTNPSSQPCRKKLLLTKKQAHTSHLHFWHRQSTKKRQTRLPHLYKVFLQELIMNVGRQQPHADSIWEEMLCRLHDWWWWWWCRSWWRC